MELLGTPTEDFIKRMSTDNVSFLLTNIFVYFNHAFVKLLITHQK